MRREIAIGVAVPRLGGMTPQSEARIAIDGTAHGTGRSRGAASVVMRIVRSRCDP
jgi:hypothetical protein